MPFHAAIFKLTAFCNLDCDYCYMFNLADRTFTRVPKQMPVETALRALDRLVAHARVNGLRELDLTLHGGEPTLWPEGNLRVLLEAIRAVPDVSFTVGLQSNGLRPFPDSLLDLLRRHRCALGISVDGPREVHDRHRKDHAGRGSYDRIMAHVHDLLERGYDDVLGGFLAVIDPTLPPARAFEWIRSLPKARVDLLWPMGPTHAAPPWRDHPGGVEAYARSPRLGAWLAEVFELWFAHDDPNLHIRGFWDLLAVMGGQRHHFDGLVNEQLSMVVVDTDGAWELPDYLRGARDRACRTGMNVRSHDLEAVARDPRFAQLLALGEHRPPACSACPLRRVCGGGFLAGRHDAHGLRLDLPSALCADQYHFYARAWNRALGPSMGRVYETLPPGTGVRADTERSASYSDSSQALR